MILATSTAILVILLNGCEQSKPPIPNNQRPECRDSICVGDVEPPRDWHTQELLKFNYKWYVGPREYFSSGTNGFAFYWPSKTPNAVAGDFPERLQVTSGKADDVAIRVFLQTKLEPPFRTGYQLLQDFEKQGRVFEKRSLHPGLEVWTVRDQGQYPALYYVATELRGLDGDPPVAGCDHHDVQFDVCTGGFGWRQDLVADFRFSGRHGPDWPDIYKEIIRVLSLLKKT
jgi:hypothetical protein